MAKKSDYKKWIWQYRKRIGEYELRTDLSVAKKRGMIENAKHKIKNYQAYVRNYEEREKLKLGTITKIKKFTEHYIGEEIYFTQSVAKSTKSLFMFKLLLENGYQSTKIARELECSRYVPPKKREQLNLILQSSPNIKTQYLNYVEEIKKQKFNQ